MFKVAAKVQTAAAMGKKPGISKDYAQSSQTDRLWGDFMRQVGSYARKSSVIKQQKSREGAGSCWYNSNPSAAL